MNKSFSILKPDVVGKNKIGEILSIIEQNGFVITNLKKLQLTQAQAEQFYAVHKGKPFFEKLIAFMISGPIVPFTVEKENAVADLRTLLGATNPEAAAEGTIRKKYATSVTINAIHGSDSDENAEIESRFFFPD